MDGLIRVRDLAREGGPDRTVRRSAERGDLSRLARGRYLPASEWAAFDQERRYRARIRAFVETTRTRQILSHWSAAVFWGYPIIGRWPERIHLTFDPRSSRRSTPRVARHLASLRDEEVVELDGLFVTSPLRTLVDLIRCAPFVTGVAACDYALAASTDVAPRVERTALVECAEQLDGQRGVARLRRVAEFADGRSGSPGESLSRVQLARLRLPSPELQWEVRDLDGNLWHTDFAWPEQGLLGEFDGMTKYTRDEYLGGRDAAEVMIEEKLREDAIRAASGCRLVRWTWPVASDPERLRRLLTGAGLHPE